MLYSARTSILWKISNLNSRKMFHICWEITTAEDCRPKIKFAFYGFMA